MTRSLIVSLVSSLVGLAALSSVTAAHAAKPGQLVRDASLKTSVRATSALDAKLDRLVAKLGPSRALTRRERVAVRTSLLAGGAAAIGTGVLLAAKGNHVAGGSLIGPGVNAVVAGTARKANLNKALGTLVLTAPASAVGGAVLGSGVKLAAGDWPAQGPRMAAAFAVGTPGLFAATFTTVSVQDAAHARPAPGL